MKLIKDTEFKKMKAIITNWEDAGMPEEMKNNLEQLAADRIQKLTDNGKFTAEEGTPFEILYSESDPMMQKENWGDDAYALYFTIKEYFKHDEENIIKLELNF